MFLGDSITGDYTGARQWPRYLSGRLNTTFVANNGKAGRVMRDLVKNPAGVALIASDFTNVDLVVCKAGTNDFSAAYAGTGTLGTINDAAAASTNFHASVKYVIETLYGLKSTMRVVFMTPMYRTAAPAAMATTPEGKTLYDYADAVKNVCALYGVPCLDLIRTAGLNSYNAATYLADGLHPTSTDGGVTIIGKPAAAWLNSIR
jgi:lysophospholipase L1-like esterase